MMPASLFNIADRQAASIQARLDPGKIWSVAPTMADERARLLQMAAEVRHVETELTRVAFQVEHMRADLVVLAAAIANIFSNIPTHTGASSPLISRARCLAVLPAISTLERCAGSAARQWVSSPEANAARARTAGEAAAGPAVVGELTSASGMTLADLASTIAQNRGQWTGTMPTLGDVTGNRGLENMVNNDQAPVRAAGSTVYGENAAATSAAQRAAVAGAAPSPSFAAQRIQDAIAARDAAVNAIPAGISQQEAGAQFRTNLQASFDQRQAARAAAGGAPYQALENSPAQMNLQPSIDYATGLAAQNAGEVG